MIPSITLARSIVSITALAIPPTAFPNPTTVNKKIPYRSPYNEQIDYYRGMGMGQL